METSNRILQCAEQLFYARGYDAVGVQEIAARSGITKPTLYYHFGSKRGLLDALLESKFRVLLEEVQKAAREGTDIQSKLRNLSRSYCLFFLQEHDFYMMLMALYYSARENEAYQTVRPYVTALYQQVVSIFEGEPDHSGSMKGRQEQFAISLIGMVNQQLMYLSDQGITDQEQCLACMESLMQQYMYGTGCCMEKPEAAAARDNRFQRNKGEGRS